MSALAGTSEVPRRHSAPRAAKLWGVAVDGRPKVIAVENGVAMGFVVLAAAAITGSPWLLVVALAAHGVKDLWQHRTTSSRPRAGGRRSA